MLLHQPDVCLGCKLQKNTHKNILQGYRLCVYTVIFTWNKTTNREFGCVSCLVVFFPSFLSHKKLVKCLDDCLSFYLLCMLVIQTYYLTMSSLQLSLLSFLYFKKLKNAITKRFHLSLWIAEGWSVPYPFIFILTE